MQSLLVGDPIIISARFISQESQHAPTGVQPDVSTLCTVAFPLNELSVDLHTQTYDVETLQVKLENRLRCANGTDNLAKCQHIPVHSSASFVGILEAVHSDNAAYAFCIQIFSHAHLLPDVSCFRSKPSIQHNLRRSSYLVMRNPMYGRLNQKHYIAL